MAKKFKLSYLTFILLTAIFSIVLISLVIQLYNTHDSYWLTIYSSWISIVASILFSTVISFIVQVINDLRARKEDMMFNEIEKYYIEAKRILRENKQFLDELALVLKEKKTLRAKDIKQVKDKLNLC